MNKNFLFLTIFLITSCSFFYLFTAPTQSAVNQLTDVTLGKITQTITGSITRQRVGFMGAGLGALGMYLYSDNTRETILRAGLPSVIGYAVFKTSEQNKFLGPVGNGLFAGFVTAVLVGHAYNQERKKKEKSFDSIQSNLDNLKEILDTVSTNVSTILSSQIPDNSSTRNLPNSSSLTGPTQQSDAGLIPGSQPRRPTSNVSFTQRSRTSFFGALVSNVFSSLF